MFGVKSLQNGIIVKIKVKPNSSEFKIKRRDKRIVIYCQSPPEKNEANREIIRELERLTKKKIKIARGLTSNKKSIIVHNITEKEFEKLIE
jgi:uncharacterized protein (TIGR00251 family)